MPFVFADCQNGDMLSGKEIAKAYLNALEKADLDSVLALFAPGGQVVSPLYGPKPVRDFYTELFEDTQRSCLTHLQTFEADQPPQLCLFFHYRWTLANGKEVDFEVVDVITLHAEGKISELKIIYDTRKSRAGWDQLQKPG